MIYEFIKNLAFQSGLNISRTTPSQEVVELVHKLAPVKTEVPLVRMGSEGDGGYLIPDDLDGITACFSPGVYEVATFEEQLIELGIDCHLADFSVDSPPNNLKFTSFEKKYIGVTNDSTFITMEAWVKRHAPDPASDLILQMDIERSEYSVILDTPAEILKRFRIIVVEFHDIDKLFDRHTIRLYRAVFEKLLNDFHVVHIHPNNWSPIVARDGVAIPPLLEFSFLRKDRSEVMGFADEFPHRFDADNVAEKPSVTLPSIWQGSA